MKFTSLAVIAVSVVHAAPGYGEQAASAPTAVGGYGAGGEKKPELKIHVPTGGYEEKSPKSGKSPKGPKSPKSPKSAKEPVKSKDTYPETDSKPVPTDETSPKAYEEKKADSPPVKPVTDSMPVTTEPSYKTPPTTDSAPVSDISGVSIYNSADNNFGKTASVLVFGLGIVFLDF